ncbi:MAG: DNA/RNA non-specific endonuclease [bacterium]|nr:DNA/RNA non-specific endonuclease [bacterium]
MQLSAWRVLIIAVVIAAGGCESIHDQFRDKSNSNTTYSNSQTRPPAPESVHLAFGNPSNATSDPANEDNFLVIGEGSVFSYNNSRAGLNWVSWRTTRDDVGDSIPRPDFRPDPRLPRWYKRIGYYDYSGSGYDRGHMVPSADRFSNPRLNEETFLMSNIVPQTGALNQYPWNKFEMYVRSQARRRLDVYQIAGCYGEAGRLKNKITVPTNCWKIAMILPRGRKPDQVDARTRILAVDMPNIEGMEKVQWEKYKTTVRTIEQRTGLNFFADRAGQLQDEVETRTDMVTP